MRGGTETYFARPADGHEVLLPGHRVVIVEAGCRAHAVRDRVRRALRRRVLVTAARCARRRRRPTGGGSRTRASRCCTVEIGSGRPPDRPTRASSSIVAGSVNRPLGVGLRLRRGDAHVADDVGALPAQRAHQVDPGLLAAGGPDADDDDRLGVQLAAADHPVERVLGRAGRARRRTPGRRSPRRRPRRCAPAVADEGWRRILLRRVERRDVAPTSSIRSTVMSSSPPSRAATTSSARRFADALRGCRRRARSALHVAERTSGRRHRGSCQALTGTTPVEARHERRLPASGARRAPAHPGSCQALTRTTPVEARHELGLAHRQGPGTFRACVDGDRSCRVRWSVLRSSCVCSTSGGRTCPPASSVTCTTTSASAMPARGGCSRC